MSAMKPRLSVKAGPVVAMMEAVRRSMSEPTIHNREPFGDPKISRVRRSDPERRFPAFAQRGGQFREDRRVSTRWSASDPHLGRVTG